MQAIAVIKHAYVVQDILLSVIATLIAAPLHPFLLETAKEAFPLPVESAKGSLPPQLLTEPYVSLSTHTALVIQPPNSKCANAQIINELWSKAPEAIALHAFYDVAVV